MTDAPTSANGSTPPRFAHLHLHTEYSLLDGGNRIRRLIDRVKDLGMDAVAITDHGNLFGAAEFYTTARAAGIRPILGIEAYVAPGDRRDRTYTGVADGGFHLVLLAENDTGWANLLRLSSDAFINGFYYKPRMDKQTLAEWGDGLIAINGHLGSSIARHLTQYVVTGQDAHFEAARQEAIWHAENFRPNAAGEPRFYIELQRHVPEQERINPHLRRLAAELDLPIVVDNDAHFLRAEDWDVHDSLCCISMGKTKDVTDRIRYPESLYVKSPAEMADLFPDAPEGLLNAARIADRCNVELDFDANHAPVVRVVHPGEPPRYDVQQDGDVTEWFKRYCARVELLPFDADRDSDVTPEELKAGCDAALRDLCEAGLIWRYGVDGITDEIRARLERELQILADKLISAYFLIVWDFVNWAHQRGIPASARGSGVGTMVGYVLGLSNACPVRYGLLFERFTDPDRTEYPDIDIDICQDGRGAVIDYVRQKYGYVAQIITFGRLKAKAAIKDVARVMGLLPSDGQRLSNLVPSELNITIDEALQKEPDFRAAYDEDPLTKRVIDTARSLEGHARHAGVHAAGVVLATRPLETIVPLYKASGSDDIVTQWDGPTCERVGLLKMDFLGLRTLSTLELARTQIRDTLDDETIWRAVGRTPGDGPHPLDLDRLAYDDPRVFSLFQRGDTSGVFQFESGGMRKLLVDMKPDRLEDLIAANALYRPGPMDLIPDYNTRKHGRQPVPRVHPIVDELTAETYGIMVYQEQVMQVLHHLGGIPLRRAYTIIKAISKKKHSVIDAARSDFVDGAAAHGVDARPAEELFELILKFAGYGFNKSHSTGYAIIAYETAYLKTYFPTQYMAAVLTFESQARKIEDWVPYLDDCRRMVYPDHTDEHPHVGIEVRPPDLNLSGRSFTVVFAPGEPRDSCHGHIRFGLGAIKGAGAAAIGSMVTEREANGPFTSIFDFCERVDLRAVNKATIEALVKGGAFDSLHGADARAALAAAIDDAVASGQSLAADRRAGQATFFEAFDEVTPSPEHTAPQLPVVPAWDQLEMLAHEKESLGFHVSGHPLNRYADILREFCTAEIAALPGLPHDRRIVLGCIVTRVRPTVTRNGRSAGSRMAMITVADRTGSVDGVLFSESFSRNGEHLANDALVILVGGVDRTRGEPQLIVDLVIPIEEAPRHLATALELEIVESTDGEPIGAAIEMVAGVLRHARATPGAGRQVDIAVIIGTAGQRIRLASRLRVTPEPTLLHRLRDQLGAANVRVRGGYVPERRDDRPSYRRSPVAV